MDSAYILNRRSFRDNRFLVDLLTKNSGRMTCVARVAKKRGKIMQGTLEPFRRVGVAWTGKGQMPTLTMVEEQRRYLLQPQDLAKGLYINELILKLVPQFAPATDIFYAYQVALYHLTTVIDELTLMRCEIGLLDALGYSLNVKVDDQAGKPIHAAYHYHYAVDSGLQLSHQAHNQYQREALISGAVLIKWQQQQPLTQGECYQLRQFLNRFIDHLLEGKLLKSRKLVFMSTTTM